MAVYTGDSHGWGLGVWLKNGCLMYPPATANKWLLVDHENQSFELTDFDYPLDNTPYKFNTCIKAANGKVYAMPLNAEVILEVDLTTNKATVVCEDDIIKAYKVYDAVLLNDGITIVSPAYLTPEILLFNTETYELTIVPIVELMENVMAGSMFAWSTVNIDHVTGKVYAIPCNENRILIMDVVDGKCTYELQDLPGFVAQCPWKWHGVDILDDTLYAAPNNAGSMLSYHVINGAISAIPIPTAQHQAPSDDNIAQTMNHGRYFDLVTANRKLYLIPRNAKHIGVYDPGERTFRMIGRELEYADIDNFFGGILGDDGNVYAGPLASPYAIKIDVMTDTVSSIRIAM